MVHSRILSYNESNKNRKEIMLEILQQGLQSIPHLPLVQKEEV